MHFHKLHGAGNDYLFFDGTERRIDADALRQCAPFLCDRHRGIGADGVVAIVGDEAADARMILFNADGSRGLTCGNALRCVGALLRSLGRVSSDTVRIATDSGVRTVTLRNAQENVLQARVDMGVPQFEPKAIPVALEGERIVERTVSIGGETVRITCVSMGNPHCVVFVPDTAQVDAARIGPLFERNALFPERTNTEWVACDARDRLTVRVFERGSGETLACGSGACAAAVAAVETGRCARDVPIAVRMPGGTLTVTVGTECVMLEGPVAFVFEGDVEIGEREA